MVGTLLVNGSILLSVFTTELPPQKSWQMSSLRIAYNISTFIHIHGFIKSNGQVVFIG